MNFPTRFLIGTAVTYAAYRYAGTPGVALVCFAALVLFLIRLRPFKTCPRCRGLGHMRRLIGPATPCRTCKGTGLATRRARRKARRLFADQSTGRTRR